MLCHYLNMLYIFSRYSWSRNHTSLSLSSSSNGMAKLLAISSSPLVDHDPSSRPTTLFWLPIFFILLKWSTTESSTKGCTTTFSSSAWFKTIMTLKQSQLCYEVGEDADNLESKSEITNNDLVTSEMSCISLRWSGVFDYKAQLPRTIFSVKLS